jgi:nicotinate-nucleotide adenylyltransferase
MSTAEIGIFGGTFDPIHNGHINSVIEAATHLSIKKVLLLPAHIPPHKERVIANSQHRLAMAEMVCQHNPLFTCDARELQRNKPSYTIDTLNEISNCYPAHKLYLFIGMDSFINFTTWHCWQDILKRCHIIVSARPNYSINQINEETLQLLTQCQAHTISTLKNANAGKVYLFEQANLSISSTEIRQQLSQHEKRLTDLPCYIFQYIKEHQLYQ